MKQAKSKQTTRILVLEPDEQLASAITSALQQGTPDALIEFTRNLEEAQKLVLGVKPDLFILDVDAAPDLGQDFLYDLRTSHPNARAIILTGAHLPEQREHVSSLGAIHFLEKPLAESDFVDLVARLLQPQAEASEKFEGTLRDLQFTDIIQLKCMSGATSVLEFTGPKGEKARVFFEKGQIRHATGPGRWGLAAFNEIVGWRGGTVSEVTTTEPSPQTIDMDWQHLLIEAVRQADEEAAKPAEKVTSGAGKLLIVDDSLMLLSFVREVLLDAGYQVESASTGEEAVRAAQSDLPGLILLDFILPDIKGDEVCRRLLENPGTAGIPVIYMSGYAAELQSSLGQHSNVIGFLNKPFTSDLLIKTVETHMPRTPDDPQPIETSHLEPEPTQATEAEFPIEQEPAYQEVSEVGPEIIPTPETPWWTPAPAPEPAAPAVFEPAAEQLHTPDESITGGEFFSGDTRFFSLNRALQIIADQKLTGTLRLFWENSPVELLVQNGQIMFATCRDAELYCPEAPVTLSNVDASRIAAARAQQEETSCPLFIALMHEDLILHEPAAQLVQHHGQKLFAQLWSVPIVRFSFEQGNLPDFASSFSGDSEVDQWALATLRFVQFPHLGKHAHYDPASIPAYTRDGFERIQNLRLTVGEAQFASQFNGARSVQQIAKNLRLDLKFASVTLFRFLALEIVECWSPTPSGGQEHKGIFQKLGQAIGLGE
jgi:DNA-binding response OmpR family regulator